MNEEKSIHPFSFTHSIDFLKMICKRMCIICLAHPFLSVTVCTGCVKCWNRRRENCCERWRQRQTLCLKGRPECVTEQSIYRRKEKVRGRRWLLRSLINSSGSTNVTIWKSTVQNGQTMCSERIQIQNKGLETHSVEIRDVYCY